MTLPFKPIGKALLTLLTLGLNQRRESSEVTTIDLTNTREATDILLNNIVKPLQDELAKTRDLLRQTRQELDEVRSQLEKLSSHMNYQPPN